MADVRSTDPNATGYRRARFRVGWGHAVAGKDYSDRVLDDVTWQNLGWRLGRAFGATSRALIEEFYELAVEQQAQQLSTGAGVAAVPHATERFPFGFSVTDEYPDARPVARGEGETVYAANGGGMSQLIIDSGALADFLDPATDAELLDELVTVHHFDDAEVRDEYLAAHYPAADSPGT
jgi:hypothetical protein